MLYHNPKSPGKSWGEIEKELLSGQKLHASILIKQINEILRKGGLLQAFPVFNNLYKIGIFNNKKITKFVLIIQS